MKFIYAVVTIILFGIQLIGGEELKCEFNNDNYHLVGSLYQCAVTSLNIPFNNMTVNRSTGVHMSNKNNNNVKAIWIHDTNTKFIPANLGSFFKLTGLAIWRTQLNEIKSADFNGMQHLEYLTFNNNELTSLSSNVFSTLPKLRYIDLYSNKIEELPKGLFDNNLNFEDIFLSDNKIKYIAIGLFNDLNKLNKVHLDNNICLSKNYVGASEITQLQKDIQSNCKNPNPITTTTTTTTTTKKPMTTTQNPLEDQRIEFDEKFRKLEKELKETQERQRLENAELLKIEQQEELQVIVEMDLMSMNNVDLKKELTEAKDVQLKVQLERDSLNIELANKTLQMNELVNEKDLLKKENNDQKKEIDDLMKMLNNRTEEVIKLNEDFKLKCKSPCEAMDSKFSGIFHEIIENRKQLLKASEEQQTKASGENQMNEILKQLLNTNEQQQKDRTEMDKLRTELAAAIDRNSKLQQDNNEQLAKCLNSIVETTTQKEW